MVTRARIVERPEDLITLGPYAEAWRGRELTGDELNPRRIVVIEGIADLIPVVRALDEVGLAHTLGGDSVALHANPREIQELREVLLRRTHPVADAVVAAIDAAMRGMRFPRDVVWPGGRLSLSKRAHVMGIVNVTPDSFSDGGRYLDPAAAIEHGRALIDQGADLLDIGGESTRPGAEPVDAATEIERVLPVVEGLAEAGVPISIDTMKAEVARAALDAGAGIINDVSAGTADDAMIPLAAERSIPIVLMHMLGEPRTMQESPTYREVVGDIAAYLAERAAFARAAGVDPGRIIVDPGFGFGKTREHNLTLLRRLRELCSLGYPVLVGTSRKSFIGATLDLPADQRLEGSAATVALAVAQGAAIVRVHDVGAMARVVGMVEAVMHSSARHVAGEPG